MAQQVQQKPTVAFNKGLITEAGELTFPEGASVDELNMTLERDGSRRRRLGIAYETGFELGPTNTEGAITTTFIWENAGNVAGLNFVVVQNGGKLYFYEETSAPLSTTRKSFVVDLTLNNRPEGFGASTTAVDMSVIEGILIVASSEINTIQVTYNDSADIVSVEEIKFRIRDFDYLSDTDSLLEEANSGTVEIVTDVNATLERAYDLKNTGWVGEKGNAALETYATSEEVTPSLTLPWYSGKDASGDFSVDEWKKTYTGTSLIANGHFVLDLYDQRRSVVSGLSGLTSEDYVESSRFKTVAAFAGRIFYAGMTNRYSNRIFFSRLLDQQQRLGECFQVNDPTSEDISDLLDTDGGIIRVEGAYNIQKLHVLGSYLIVFAENGIWTINGVDNVFRATEYAVDKISEVGFSFKGSFVSAQGRPYWWSTSGIHTIVASEEGALREQNLSISTIQTYWGEIDASKKAQVIGAYDAFNQRVVWTYPDNTSPDRRYNRLLTFDEALTAFYPWKIEQSEKFILGAFYLDGRLTESVEFSVIDSEGNFVVDSSGNQVVVTRPARDYTSSQLTFLVRDTSGKLTFAAFTGTDFLDWGTDNYSSYAETGYDFSGDLTTKKTMVYLTTFMKSTEEGVVGTDETGYDYIRPSSCLLSTFWDYRKTSAGVQQQTYRLKQIPILESSSETPPFEVVTSRLRVRGRGRSLRLRFESEQGKDFHLLGYDTIVGKNRGY